MESAEELTITTIRAFYNPDSESTVQGAKVSFLVRNLCDSQPFLLIEKDVPLHSDDDDKTMMEAERILAHHFRRLAEILEGRVLIREERDSVE